MKTQVEETRELNLQFQNAVALDISERNCLYSNGNERIELWAVVGQKYQTFG